MGTEIKGATISPRYENNILYWYYKDTFELDWKFNIKQDGTEYTIQPEDKITINFYMGCRLVHSFVFENIVDNTIKVMFTPEISNKFIPGEYSYCVKFNQYIDGAYSNTTIGANYTAIVEVCH